jgi:TPR repeat protein
MSSKVDDENVTSCTDELKNVHITCTDEVDVCANCGEEGSDGLKACTACKMVKYCNRDCQIAHRSKHKKACRKRAAEIHDEELFKQPPPKEDCPICLLRLPLLPSGSTYMSCCGKNICCGCRHATVYDKLGNEIRIIEEKCPFCRTPGAQLKEYFERLQKRVDLDDAEAIRNLGCYYRDGEGGFPQDYDKALELFVRAGDLGHATAYCNVGYAYDFGNGVEIDKKKANHYYKLAAIGGSIEARHNLGGSEVRVGNMNRALKHFMIAAEGGESHSLKVIQQLYSKGHATKDDYAKALQAYQAYLAEIKSTQRDAAAAARANYRYY